MTGASEANTNGDSADDDDNDDDEDEDEDDDDDDDEEAAELPFGAMVVVRRSRPGGPPLALDRIIADFEFADEGLPFADEEDEDEDEEEEALSVSWRMRSSSAPTRT